MILVTGAGGFVGGHVARALAGSGHPVRGLSRRPPAVGPDDPPIEWMVGDLRRADDRGRALAGVSAVVHSAGWVSLGRDPSGEGYAVNVEATRALLDEAAASGVGRFLFTSTLWTVAAGRPTRPADERTAWNLDPVRCPYSETKREAERAVLERDGPRFHTSVLCPAMVIGPRDVRPTSTRLLLRMARARVMPLPEGGIPIIDARVLARAHVQALQRAEGGRRYIVAGPYLSYHELAALVARVAGRPGRVVRLGGGWQGPLTWLARWADRLAPGCWGDFSPASIAGGFLPLHVSGALADATFGLDHPPPIRSIFEALDDHHRSGRAPWLRLRPPDD